MDKDRMPLDKLRQEVMSGKITYDDIIKRLSVAIESEYLKDSPDVELIDTCEDLLWEIGTEGQQEFTSVSQCCLEMVKNHTYVAMQRRTKREQSYGFAGRFAIVLVALALLFFSTSGVIHIGWFTQSSSHDEQQYIIQGHSVDVKLIAQSISEHNEFGSIQTNDWNEFVDYLGFAPQIIDPTLFGTDDMQYIAFIESDVIMLVVRYYASTDKPIILTTNHFLEEQEAYVALEQDTTGTKHSIGNTVVYCSTNMDNVLLTWIEENALYSILCDSNNDECFDWIRNMTGGRK